MKKLAVLLAALLALILTIAASAADPIISLDFANGAGDVELVNADIVEDATRGKVLEVSGDGAGSTGQSYGLYTTDVFENTNFDDGLTVSLWYKTEVGSQTLKGTAPIFSIDIANVGYIAMVTSLESAINTDGNDTSLGISPRMWNDPANVSGGVNMTEEGVWQQMTVVYSTDGMKVYIDGELYSEPVVNGGMTDYLLWELEYAYSLRLGSWLCSWWNYGDYEGMIDDVFVYNTALSDDEVSELYDSTKQTQTVFEEAPALEDLYTAEEHDFVYYMNFDDASTVELVNAEIVSDDRGAALKVGGTGSGTNGTSYGLITTDLFKNTDWSKGMTISMWVKRADSETLTGMAPLYSLDIARIGYIGTVSSLQSGINTDGNEDVGLVPRFWNDPGNQGDCKPATEAGKWQNVIVVYGGNEMAIYLDGENVGKPVINIADAFGPGTIEQFYTEQLNEVYSLRLGSWLCDWWNYGDFEGLIDDIAIYNCALNPLEAKNVSLGNSTVLPVEDPTPAEEVAPAAEEAAPAAEEPAEIEVEEPEIVEIVETVEAVEAVEETAPAAPAPQTFDFGVIAAVAAVLSAAGYAVSRKRS